MIKKIGSICSLFILFCNISLADNSINTSRDPSTFSVICTSKEGYALPLYNLGNQAEVNPLFLKPGAITLKGSTLYRITDRKVYRSTPDIGMPEEEFGEIKPATNGQFISIGYGTKYGSVARRHGNFGTLIFDFSYDHSPDMGDRQPLIGTVIDADATGVSVLGIMCSRSKPK